MAFGTITLGAAASNLKGAASAPTFADSLSMPGNDSYVTGGNTGFDAIITTAMGKTPTPIAVISGDCGDNYCTYKPANGGTLMVFVRSTGAEVANAADLSGATFNLTVLYK